MQDESTGKVKQNGIQTAGCHGHESRRPSRRTHKARQSEIRPYLATIKNRKRLTASEETSLAEAIARGDKERTLAVDRVQPGTGGENCSGVYGAWRDDR